jgi:hypothetical protein
LSGHQKEALFHLKKAVQEVDVEYIVGSFKETAAPLHVYYYLTLALVESDKCAEANRAFEEFKTYEENVDQYFIAEADRHLQKCPYEPEEKTEQWNEPIEIPEGYEPEKIIIEAPPKVDSSAIENHGLVVEKLEYTTNAPLYGVQIASNKNPTPISSYGKLKNVDVFVDNEGMIRYVVGHFAYYQQAEKLLEKLKTQGYEDAYIVNVNDERKYSNEVISFNNVNLRSGIKGEVEYYVQLGAFEEEVPDDMMEAYLTVSGIEEIKYEGMTIIAVGAFASHKAALAKKKEIQAKGFEKAYIAAFNKGKKIPLDEAINYTE